MLPFFNKEKNIQQPLRSPGWAEVIKSGLHMCNHFPASCQSSYICTLLHEANFSQPGPLPTHSARYIIQ